MPEGAGKYRRIAGKYRRIATPALTLGPLPEPTAVTVKYCVGVWVLRIGFERLVDIVLFFVSTSG